MPKGTPAYITTDANGRVGADFSGHISASGVDLLAGAGAAGPDNKVTWHRDTITGGVVADVEAFQDATHGYMQLFAKAPLAAGTPTELAMVASDTNAQSYLLVAAGLKSGIVLRGDGASSFVQTPAGGQRIHIAFGQGTVTWPGATADSNTVTIANGLPAGPLGVLYYALGISTDTAFYMREIAPSLGDCGYRAWSTGGSPPAGHTQDFHWLAIGSYL